MTGMGPMIHLGVRILAGLAKERRRADHLVFSWECYSAGIEDKILFELALSHFANNQPDEAKLSAVKIQDNGLREFVNSIVNSTYSEEVERFYDLEMGFREIDIVRIQTNFERGLLAKDDVLAPLRRLRKSYEFKVSDPNTVVIYDEHVIKIGQAQSFAQEYLDNKINYISSYEPEKLYPENVRKFYCKFEEIMDRIYDGIGFETIVGDYTELVDEFCNLCEIDGDAKEFDLLRIRIAQLPPRLASAIESDIRYKELDREMGLHYLEDLRMYLVNFVQRFSDEESVGAVQFSVEQSLCLHYKLHINDLDAIYEELA